MLFESNRRASVIALELSATILLTACLATATEPRTNRASEQIAHADEVPADTLDCKSGYVIVEGRVVCN